MVKFVGLQQKIGNIKDIHGDTLWIPLVNVHKTLWKDPTFAMGKSTISMTIFSSYVKLPEGMGC